MDLNNFQALEDATDDEQHWLWYSISFIFHGLKIKYTGNERM